MIKVCDDEVWQFCNCLVNSFWPKCSSSVTARPHGQPHSQLPVCWLFVLTQTISFFKKWLDLFLFEPKQNFCLCVEGSSCLWCELVPTADNKFQRTHKCSCTAKDSKFGRFDAALVGSYAQTDIHTLLFLFLEVLCHWLWNCSANCAKPVLNGHDILLGIGKKWRFAREQLLD